MPADVTTSESQLLYVLAIFLPSSSLHLALISRSHFTATDPVPKFKSMLVQSSTAIVYLCLQRSQQGWSGPYECKMSVVNG